MQEYWLWKRGALLGYMAQYPGSVVFYLLLVVVCCLLARAAEELDRPLPLIAAVVLLVAMSALRAPSVGIDTNSYAIAYNGVVPSYFEPGFVWFIHLLKPLNSLKIYFGSIALVVYGFTFARFWQLRRYCSLTLAVAVYMLVFFPSTWNGLRSCIVTAVMFYSLGFIEKQRYASFLMAVGLCCSIHYSSIAFSLLILASPWWTQGLTRNRKTALTLVLSLVVAFVVVAFFWMMSSGLFTRYGDEYGNKASMSRIGLSWYLYFALMLACWHMLKSEERGTEERARTKTYLLYAILGTGLFISGFVWFGGGRLSSYFNIYSTLVLARFWAISRSYRYGMFYRFGAMTYCCYAFFQVLMSNGQGLLPYVLG